MSDFRGEFPILKKSQIERPGAFTSSSSENARSSNWDRFEKFLIKKWSPKRKSGQKGFKRWKITP